MSRPKNLAALKRYIKEGMEFIFATHGYQAHRRVVKKQTNMIAFREAESEGIKWMQYPKAKDITFTDEYFSINSHFGNELRYYYQ